MTNEQLVIRIKAGENVAENMAQLYEQTKKFIHAIAWKYRGSGELEDLEQEGYLALYPAIDGYDPAAGCKFLTYAEYWVKQRIRRYVQTNSRCLHLPIQCLEKVQQYEKLCNTYQIELGRKPTDYEAAVCMGNTMEQVENIRRNACMTKIGSLDAPVMGADGGEDSTVGKFVPDGCNLEESVIDRSEKGRLCSVLWDCVNQLSGEQPDVLRMRYREKLDPFGDRTAAGNHSGSCTADSCQGTARTAEIKAQKTAAAIRTGVRADIQQITDRLRWGEFCSHLDKQRGKDGSGRVGAKKIAGYGGTKMELRKRTHSTKRTYIRKKNNKNKGNKCSEWM